MARRKPGALALGLLARGPWAAGADARGNQECWMGAITYDFCCYPEPDGNPMCWDHYFSKEMCCTEAPGADAPASPAPPPAPPVLVPPGGDADGGDDVGVRGLFGGCEWAFFQDFKRKAHDWFLQRKVQLSMFHEFASIVAQWEDVFESCPAAALTAFLLKMEAGYFETEQKFYSLLDIYVNSYQRAVAEGTLLQSHHKNGWPLLEGMKRVLTLRSGGREKALEREQLTSRGEAVPPSVDLVICFCAERLVWLRALHKLPWRDEDRSNAMRTYVALRVYHKCPPHSTAEQEVERQRLVNDWQSYFREVEVRFVLDKVRADDCSAYLAYIVDRYETLPEYTVFLHADAPEHIPSLELLTDTVYASALGYLPAQTQFVHLAHNHVLHACLEGHTCDSGKFDGFEFPRLWKSVFGSSIVPSLSGGQIHAYCCVQFLVQRERIRLRPWSFFKNALDYFGDTAESYHQLFPARRHVWKPDTVGRTPCQHAMYIWHAMFGAELRFPRRQKDVDMPLFMKLVNIEVEALEGEQMNDAYIDNFIAAHASGEHSTAARVGSLFT